MQRLGPKHLGGCQWVIQSLGRPWVLNISIEIAPEHKHRAVALLDEKVTVKVTTGAGKNFVSH